MRGLVDSGRPFGGAAIRPGRERPVLRAGGAGRRRAGGAAGARPAARAGDRRGRRRPRPGVRVRGRVRLQRRPRAGGRVGPAGRVARRPPRRRQPAPAGRGRGARRRGRRWRGRRRCRRCWPPRCCARPAAAPPGRRWCRSLPRAIAAGWFYVRNVSLYGDPTGGSYLLDLLDRPHRGSRRSAWPSTPASGRRSRRTRGAASRRCRVRSSCCWRWRPSRCFAWQVWRHADRAVADARRLRACWCWPRSCQFHAAGGSAHGRYLYPLLIVAGAGVGVTAARARVASAVGVVVLVVLRRPPPARRAGALRARAASAATARSRRRRCAGPACRRPRRGAGAPRRRAGGVHRDRGARAALAPGTDLTYAAAHVPPLPAPHLHRSIPPTAEEWVGLFYAAHRPVARAVRLLGRRQLPVATTAPASSGSRRTTAPTAGTPPRRTYYASPERERAAVQDDATTSPGTTSRW